jgi:hypothetical protein
MNSSTGSLAGAALLTAALWVGGCSTVGGVVQRQRAAGSEAALAAAGFQIEPANTPDRIRELARVPPFILVPRMRDGETVYVYADPVTCHCEYVGSVQQYAEYERQRSAALHAAEGREALAAEERSETYADGQAPWSSPWLW